MEQSNEDLIFQLKKALATVFTFYMKAHNYHVNVTGSDFSQYHEYFGSIYSEVWGWADELAEEIRTLDSFSPFSYSRFLELTDISEDTTVPAVETMFQNLVTDNATMLQTLYTTRAAAEAVGNFGITNHIEDMITASQKRQWMLKSFKV